MCNTQHQMCSYTALVTAEFTMPQCKDFSWLYTFSGWDWDLKHLKTSEKCYPGINIPLKQKTFPSYKVQLTSFRLHVNIFSVISFQCDLFSPINKSLLQHECVVLLDGFSNKTEVNGTTPLNTPSSLMLL